MNIDSVRGARLTIYAMIYLLTAVKPQARLFEGFAELRAFDESTGDRQRPNEKVFVELKEICYGSKTVRKKKKHTRMTMWFLKFCRVSLGRFKVAVQMTC